MKKITKTIKVLILILILNIVIWGGFYVGLSQIDKLKETLIGVNKSIEENKLEQRKEQMMAILSNDIKKSEDDVKKHFFSNTETLREAINIQNQMKSIMESSGVKVEGLIKVDEISQINGETKKVDGKEVKEVKADSQVSAYRISLKGNGSWSAITALTKTIEKAPFLATIESVSYSTSKDKTGWTIKMTITAPSINK